MAANSTIPMQICDQNSLFEISRARMFSWDHFAKIGFCPYRRKYQYSRKEIFFWNKMFFCPYAMKYQHFEKIMFFWDLFEKSSYLRKYQNSRKMTSIRSSWIDYFLTIYHIYKYQEKRISLKNAFVSHISVKNFVEHFFLITNHFIACFYILLIEGILVLSIRV